MFHYWFYKFRWYVSIVVLLCIAITLMKYSAWIDRHLFGSVKKKTPVVSRQRAAPSPDPSVTSPSPWDAAVVRKQLAEANSLLSEASIYVSEALKKVRTWQRDIEPLRNRTLDPSMADQDDLVAKLAYLFRHDRMTTTELREASSRIDALRRKVNGLTTQAIPKPLPETELVEVSELHHQCQAANEDWELAVQRALAIKRSIENPAASNVAPRAPASIGEKMKDADAKATLADLEAQIEHDRKQKEAERKRAAELAEQKRKQEKREAELLARATSPEVTAILAPFLQPRDVQPRMAGASVHFRKTFATKPMSLSALQGMNALSPSIDGLRRLAKAGGHRKLSPPGWSVPSQPNSWTDADKEMLQTAQRLLLEYGPILVKAGKLSE